MMTELSEIRSELAESFEELFELNHIFTLALNQFPDEPEEIWQKQVTWIISLLASDVERRADVIRGQVYALDRLQAACSREVSK
jgi:hypothetical protein